MYIAPSKSFNGFKLSIKISTFFLNGFPVYIPLLLKAPSIGCWVGVWVILKILPLTGLFHAQPVCIHILTVVTDTQRLAPAPVQAQPHLAHITPRTYPSLDMESHCSTDRCVCLHDCLCHLLGSLFYPHLCREDSVPLSRDNPNITASLMLLEMIPVRNAHGSLRTQNASLQPTVCSYKISRIISCSLAFVYLQAFLWVCLSLRRQQHSGGQTLAVPAAHPQGKMP